MAAIRVNLSLVVDHLVPALGWNQMLNAGLASYRLWPESYTRGSLMLTLFLVLSAFTINIATYNICIF